MGARRKAASAARCARVGARSIPVGAIWAAVSVACVGTASCRADGLPADDVPDRATAAAGPAAGGGTANAAGRDGTAQPEVVPAWEAVVRGRPAVAVRAVTTATVRQSGRTVEIGDEKRISRNTAGDFDLQVRRTHRGAESGDTEETFRAVSVGAGRGEAGFFTRGSGGPFVRWDDARDEPGRVARDAWSDTVALVRLAAGCADVRRDGSRTVLTSRPGECRVSHAGTAPTATLLVREASGEVGWDGERLVAVAVKAVVIVEAGGRSGDVTIEHEADLSDLPASAKVEAPADAVDSRRERPVRMIGAVLGGLLEQ